MCIKVNGSLFDLTGLNLIDWVRAEEARWRKKDVDIETGCPSLSLNLPSQLGFELDSTISWMPKWHSETEKIYFGANLVRKYQIVLSAPKPKLMCNL